MLSEEQITAIAREWCNHTAHECRVDPDYNWKYYSEVHKQDIRLIAALIEAALAQQQEPVAVPAGATHYQPHQKTYYKRVSATEWYFWSCTGKSWIEAKGTDDSAEWICLHPVAAPVAAQPVNQMLLDALHNISLCSQNSMSSQRQCGEIARAAIAAAEGKKC